MRHNKRHLTQEAFLYATFVELNKCWISGKSSRLFIETVKGNAFVNFSVFLGHPGNVHFVPKNPQPAAAKKKVKSKRKTERDNLRAAQFQERKKKEMETAASAEATEAEQADPSPPPLPPNTSSPVTQGPSHEFSFAEPVLKNISSDMSVENYLSKDSDGNATIPQRASSKGPFVNE